MRRISCFAVVVLISCLISQPLEAWWNGGHMLVAYVAYKKLSPHTRTRVDVLLRKNPQYAQWTKGVSKKQRGLAAFVMAATWADCIKSASCAAGYRSDGGDTPPGDATDAQNIGYADHLMHRYWHFVDEPFSEGAPAQPPKNPNALTEIVLLSAAIGTGESDDVKSYDVTWLEHLVGDVHQPLHATSRFTANHPNGDAGGNFVFFCAKPCKDELHAYWDALLGDAPTVAQVTTQGNKLLKMPKPEGAGEAAPDVWVNESLELAENTVYAAPISDDNDPNVKISPRPDDAYAQKAMATAQAQALVAGYRLANLLDTCLQ